MYLYIYLNSLIWLEYHKRESRDLPLAKEDQLFLDQYCQSTRKVRFE